jgi:hypothetical protein
VTTIRRFSNHRSELLEQQMENGLPVRTGDRNSGGSPSTCNRTNLKRTRQVDWERPPIIHATKVGRMEVWQM